MIRFTVNDQTVEFDESKMLFAEARAIESVTGQTFQDAMTQIQAGSFTALQAFVWVAFKRSNPALKFSDLDDWNIGDLDVSVPDDDEAADAGPLVDSVPASG